jgi:peptidyl-prolyl cis-trans isomerase C
MKKNLKVALVLMAVFLFVFEGADLFSESEKILARVGKEVITQRELDLLVSRYENFRKGSSLNPEEKRNLLNMLITQSLFGIAAEKESLDKKPDVQSKLKLFRKELLAQEYVAAKIEPQVKVHDREVDEILRKNPNLVPEETLTLKEVVVKTEREAEEIYKKLKKGADFSRIASEESISPTRSRGGFMGTYSRGQLPSPVETVVYQLKEGEFTRPIKTEAGFQIIYLIDRKQVSLEETKRFEEKIREKVFQLEKNKKIEEKVKERVGELQKQVKVEIYWDRMK